MNAQEFNNLFDIGTLVHYHPVINRDHHIVTKTRSSAWTLPSGQDVVMVEGRSGGVALEAVRIPEEIMAYALLGQKIEHHKLDCVCVDCRAFLKAGDELNARNSME